MRPGPIWLMCCLLGAGLPAPAAAPAGSAAARAQTAAPSPAAPDTTVAPSPGFPPPPDSMPGATRFVYKRGAGFTLPVFVFRPGPASAAEPRAPRALVVFFHGSGWKAGSVLQFADYARLLASHGTAAAVAEYRVKERYGATPFDAVADAKSTIRWLRANAAELGIDPHRIIAAGASAGAHIALAAALFEESFDDPADDLSVSARPDALALFVPVVDTTEAGYPDGVPLFGGRERELSPQHHLKPGLPPILIFQGTNDDWVSFQSVERFTIEAHRLNNECELIAFDGRNHHFYNHPHYIEMRPHLGGSYAESDFVLSFFLLERFLYDHGFVQSRPRVLKFPPALEDTAVRP